MNQSLFVNFILYVNVCIELTLPLTTMLYVSRHDKIIVLRTWLQKMYGGRILHNIKRIVIGICKSCDLLATHVYRVK